MLEEKGEAMAINVFEGARRIAKLFAAIWVIGWIVAAFYVSPSINVTYKIVGPGKAPVRLTEGCPSDSAREYRSIKTNSGTEAWVTLCFFAISAEDGTSMIPFYVDPETKALWGKEKYSTEVSQYTNRVAASFTISQADGEWIDSQWWPQFLKELGEGALVAIGGLLFLWTFTWGTGWIVRGFMSIPRGKDRREKRADTLSSRPP